MGCGRNVIKKRGGGGKAKTNSNKQGKKGGKNGNLKRIILFECSLIRITSCIFYLKIIHSTMLESDDIKSIKSKGHAACFIYDEDY